MTYEETLSHCRSSFRDKSNAIALFCADIFVSPVSPNLLPLRHKA